jgi:uncharacterized membrane protein YfcA
VGRAIHESPLPENGGWAGRFVNRPYNFVADLRCRTSLQERKGCATSLTTGKKSLKDFMEPLLLAYVGAVLLVSSLIRIVFGFGNALIAMLFLALSPLGIKTVTPLVALVAFTLSLQILVHDWKQVDFISCWRLIVSSVVGIPAGVILIKYADEGAVLLILAFVILIFSSFSLAKPQRRKPVKEAYSYLFGFISGVLGGSYNANGAPIVIYGTLRKWPPDVLRANLQGYFFPTSLFILTSHALGGLWTSQVGWLYLFSLPLIGVAIVTGGMINRRLPPALFETILHLFLILVAIIMIFRAIMTY